MDLIKDNLTAFIFIIIFAITFLVLMVTAIIFFAMDRFSKHKNATLIDFTVGIEVDLKNARVIYFERKNLSQRRVLSLESFFQLFHKKDILRVKLWFEDIKRNFDFSEKYLETETINRTNEGYFLLLKAIHFDETNQILYLEGHQLNMMNASQGRKRSSNSEYSLIKKSQIESVFESLKKKDGYVFSIKFFYRNNDVINDANIEKSILLKLKNQVYDFAAKDKNNRFVLDEYDDQIYIFNFKIYDDDSAKAFAQEIYSDIQKFLELKALSSTHGVAIGVVNMSAPNVSFETFFRKSSKASESARMNDLPFLIMDDSNENIQSFDNNLVEKIFDSGSLHLLYRPIININTEQIIGYFSNVKIADTFFENYFDIARYVNRVDRNEELLSKVIQQFVSKFFFERPNNKARLFVQISLVDLDHLSNVLTNISHAKEANIVLLFEESEVNANAFSLDLLTTQLHEIMSLGFETALLLKHENTLLENSFYSIFNYFVIGSAMVSKIKDSNRVRLSNKFLIESLLQYKRPIVINDLDGWSSIDLFVKSGCNFLSGDDISPSSEMLLPIEKTKIARLRKIKN